MPESLFCENSKNTFFTEHLWTTASLDLANLSQILFNKKLYNQAFLKIETAKDNFICLHKELLLSYFSRALALLSEQFF